MDHINANAQTWHVCIVFVCCGILKNSYNFHRVVNMETTSTTELLSAWTFLPDTDNETVNATEASGGSFSQTPLIWKILEGFIGSLGVAGNGLVLFVFFKEKSLRSLINSFIINQSLIDFVTSFVFLLVSFLPSRLLDPTNAAHVVFCQIWVSEYVMWALFISSSVNLVCITFDRYFAIIYPAKYRSSASIIQRRIKVVAVLTWSSGFIFDCYWAAIQAVFPSGHCIPNWTNKILQGITGVFIFVVTYAGPLTVMIFCYARILSKLRKQSAQASTQVAPPKASSTRRAIRRSRRAMSERSERAARNVITTMATVSFTYAICWAPIAFNYLVYNLGGPLDFMGVWYGVTKIFVYANMCANPFIYTMQYRQFQKGFERVFKVKLYGPRDLPVSVTKTASITGASSDNETQDALV